MSFFKSLVGGLTSAAGSAAGLLLPGPAGKVAELGLGALGGALSDESATENSLNASMTLQQHQADLSQANWQKQFDITNAYNTPAAQMQRLKDAGLNPNLAYGSLTGNLAASPSAAMPNGSVNAKQEMQMAAYQRQVELMQQRREQEIADSVVEKNRADSEVSWSQANYYEEMAEHQRIDNAAYEPNASEYYRVRNLLLDSQATATANEANMILDNKKIWKPLEMAIMKYNAQTQRQQVVNAFSLGLKQLAFQYYRLRTIEEPLAKANLQILGEKFTEQVLQNGMLAKQFESFTAEQWNRWINQWIHTGLDVSKEIRNWTPMGINSIGTDSYSKDFYDADGNIIGSQTVNHTLRNGTVKAYNR